MRHGEGRRPLVRERLQAGHEQHERAGVERSAGITGATWRRFRRRQSADRDSDGDDADRDVDREQPAPLCHGQHCRGYGGSDRGGSCDDEGVDSDRPPEHVLRISEAHESGIHTHDPGGTESLNHARRAQHAQRRGEGAGKRCQGEHRQARLRDAAVSDPLSQGGERQQGDEDGELIGIDHPHR